MLLVEQNAAIALKVAHHGYVLETGEIALSGEAQQLLNEEKVKQAYLGVSFIHGLKAPHPGKAAMSGPSFDRIKLSALAKKC